MKTGGLASRFVWKLWQSSGAAMADSRRSKNFNENKVVTILGPGTVVNGDIHADVDFSHLALPAGDLAHLLMVAPPEGSTGDFTLDAQGRMSPDSDGNGERLTYSGISIIHPALFADWRSAFASDDIHGHPPAFRLAPLLRHAMRQGRIGGQRHRGHWTDAGTHETLARLRAMVTA